MKKMKGVKKLEKHITKAVYNAVGEYFPCRLAIDFMCDLMKDEIDFSLFIQEHSDELWREWLLDTYGEEVRDMVFFSLLHEIGHLMTNDITSEEWEISQAVKPLISEQLDALEWHSYAWRQKYKEYFALPVEKQATEWAIEFNKTDAAQYLYEKMENAILKFYEKNRVEF